MDKARKEIVIFSLVLVGLLVVLLYSPVGSPDYYYPASYTFTNQNVKLGAPISNAPKFNQSFQTYDEEPIIPDNESSWKIESKYSFSPTTGAGDFGRPVGLGNFDRSGASQSNSGQLANGFVFGFSSSRSGSGSSMQENGFTAVVADLSASNSATNRQSAPYNPGGGGTDPGADPAHHQPIPVGDGCFILLFFMVTYVVIKRIVLK